MLYYVYALVRTVFHFAKMKQRKSVGNFFYFYPPLLQKAFGLYLSFLLCNSENMYPGNEMHSLEIFFAIIVTCMYFIYLLVILSKRFRSFTST